MEFTCSENEGGPKPHPIAGCAPYTIVEKSGFKIGILGFAEEAWLDCLPQCVDV